MLIGYNTLRFLEDKSLQRWLNADNKYVYPYFGINKMPAFVLISNTAQTTATVQLFDANTDVAFGAAQAVTVTTSGSNKQLFFAGVTLAAGVEGCYYLKIITGATIETYYSEVFGWTEDSTANLKEMGLLKISATSSDITLSNTYEITMTGITYECFIEVDSPIEDAEIDEEGNEQPYGDIATFNTLAFTSEYEIFGNYDIFRFLSGLRILKTNGTVTFTYNGISVSGYDITCEKDNATEDTVSMKLKYKHTDYISSRNA